MCLAAPARAAERPELPTAQPATPIRWQFPQSTTTTTTSRPVLSLTFDDGPNETFTPQILDVLARANVKATFFVLGSAVERSPELARRIVADGHRVANHSWDHANLTAVDADVLDEEIDKTTAVITAVTGVTPRCLRPPFGKTNDAVRVAARASGLAIANWSKDTRDYERPGVRSIVARAIEGAVPGGVILFHDSGPDVSQTVAALPAIITGIQKRGLRIAPIC
jgi:peptidoglycan-N-acetylglucosamine deacetylase